MISYIEYNEFEKVDIRVGTIIEAKRDINEENLLKLIFKDEKINKYIEKKEITKKIFIPNKLMNIII